MTDILPSGSCEPIHCRLLKLRRDEVRSEPLIEQWIDEKTGLLTLESFTSPDHRRLSQNGKVGRERPKGPK